MPKALESLPAKLRDGLDAAVLKAKLTTMQADRAFQSVSPCARLEDLAGADLVIEAASEDLALKRELFARLDAVCPDAVLATNTSSLSVAAIAQAVKAPARVLGIHFFNPPVAMKLVEMIRTEMTSPEVFHGAWDFVLMGLRKTPVDVKDTPGFIVNRVMRPYYVESLRVVEEGQGTPLSVDNRARENGAPLGPFALMDLIGLDVNLAITKSIYEALGRPERFKPSPIQQDYVDNGELGRKTGRGFYVYEDGKLKPDAMWRGMNPRIAGFLPAGCRYDFAGPLAPDPWPRMAGAIFAEARGLVEAGAAGKNDVDTAIRLAMNFPKGPFEWQSENTARPAN